MDKSLEQIIEEIKNLSKEEFNEKLTKIILEVNKQKIDIEFMNIDDINDKLKDIMFDTIIFIDELHQKERKNG